MAFSPLLGQENVVELGFVDFHCYVYVVACEIST